MQRHPPLYPSPTVMLDAVDSSGTVVARLTCRRCQYNLRTLSLSGRCPECGLSVGFSAETQQITLSDPA
jgi:hypothetical protein